MSATANSSCGTLSEALQRNAKHEARLSNISGLFPFENIETKLIRFFSRDCGIRMTPVRGRVTQHTRYRLRCTQLSISKMT